ncbi:MAG: J domain-containing protein [Deltaproteobacteria bacterium]|nr:J domain-containing protein [Deltaproteobacteria bacterium]MBW2421863.1 J domain-containing protein [Deltaproteobacteria bacterium]
MEERDLYSILGVSRDASQDEIRKAYRKLAREHHPDVNPGDSQAEERFKDISGAYGILSDEAKRSRYDEFGMQGVQEGFDPEQARAYRHWSAGAGRSPFQQDGGRGIDTEEMLADLFGGARARAGPRRGANALGEVEVDFLDAVRGSEVPLHFEGRAPLRVKIPPGAEDGTKIRLAGQGAPGHEGGPPGDLFVTLRVRPHPFFTRQGADLFVDVPVTLSELVRGASIEVPTPNGQANMKVPAGSPNGRKLRLRNAGAPRRGGKGNGDLYVKLILEVPRTDDPKLAEIADELDELYPEADVRRRLKRSR